MNSAASTFNLITSAIKDAEVSNGRIPCLINQYHDHLGTSRFIRRQFDADVPIDGSCSSPTSSSGDPDNGDDVGNEEQYAGNEEDDNWNRVTFALHRQGIPVRTVKDERT